MSEGISQSWPSECCLRCWGTSQGRAETKTENCCYGANGVPKRIPISDGSLTYVMRKAPSDGSKERTNRTVFLRSQLSSKARPNPALGTRARSTPPYRVRVALPRMRARAPLSNRVKPANGVERIEKPLPNGHLISLLSNRLLVKVSNAAFPILLLFRVSCLQFHGVFDAVVSLVLR